MSKLSIEQRAHDLAILSAQVSTEIKIRNARNINTESESNTITVKTDIAEDYLNAYNLSLEFLKKHFKD